MNTFLQSESIEQAVRCNKNGKKNHLAGDLMDYENQAQLKSNKVDFNLNNISDATDTSSGSSDPKRSTKSQPANQPAVNDHHQPLPKSIDIEQLKQSSKRKAGRILRRIEKIQKRLNCTGQYAFDLMSDRKQQRISRNAPNRLSLEDYLNQENGLRNKLKVSI